jgi:hypothetical protein
MSILHSMSAEDRTAYKAQKTKEMRDYNADIIKDLGLSIYDFNMKTQFRDEQGRLVVGIFSSEFKKSNGFFFELIDSDLNPVDPERKIYRVPYNLNFEEEYELNAKGSFLVPLEELKIVNRQSVAISKMGAISTAPVKEPVSTSVFKVTEKAQATVNVQRAPSPMEDASYSEMTIRDYFAIQTGKPVSAKNWLNDLIKNK